MAKFDRFQPPDSRDELVYCASCLQRMAYTGLTDDGLCADCHDLYFDDDEEKPQERRIECSFSVSQEIKK
jgi:hypothetical protein